MPRTAQGTLPPLTNAVTGITALAGGARSAATPVLSGGFNEVTTVATATDSVCLPPAVYGMEIVVHNAAAANAMQVFAAFGTTDTINGVAAATGVAQAAGKGAIYACYADGKWTRVLSA
jgi:hypothetical protein